MAVSVIKEANRSGCRISRACEALGVSKRTFERWQKNMEGDRRRGPISPPANKFSPEEKRRIIETVASSEFCDKSPAQIVPLLADQGKYLGSESSFYRILRAEGMNRHRNRAKPATHKRPKELVATKPNQIYSWDITYLKSPVSGMFYYLYFFMDIYSRKIVGHAVHQEQSSTHAAQVIDKVCQRERIDKNQLILRSDNGGPMKGATMLATLQRLGVVPSFSRPTVSDDNPYSEALFRTAKYCPLYPSKPFQSLGEAETWVDKFVHWYNEEHLHSGIKFVTPGSRHRGEDVEILRKRDQVYQRAKSLRPDRWSRSSRNWTPPSEVCLNRLSKKTVSCNKVAA